MTPEQIEDLQTSFAKVAPMSQAAAALFYERLFTIAPEVKPLSKTEMIRAAYPAKEAEPVDG